MELELTRDQIWDQIDAAQTQIHSGAGSRFPGMSYEDGVIAALQWALGEVDEVPYPAE